MTAIKRVIEQVTNIAIVIVCVLLCWSYLTKRNVKSANGRPGISSEQLVGLTLPTIPGYSWGSQPETLVMAIRVGCHYCADSMPFYMKLNDLERSNHLRAHLLVVMQEGKQAADQELNSDGLKIDRAFNQSFGPLKVTGTPTLMLANAQGRIVKGWVGELSPQGEREVIAAVGK